MKAIILCLIFSLVASLASGTEPLRIWKNNTGQTIEATFLRFVKEKVQIKRKDGRTFTLDANQLSNADQVYLEEVRKRTDETGELWTKGRAEYLLCRQKWIDRKAGERIPWYYVFSKERIDINKDGKVDGFKVSRERTESKLVEHYAWDVSPNGELLFRVLSGVKIYENRFRFDFENNAFVRVSGTTWPYVLRPVR